MVSAWACRIKILNHSSEIFSRSIWLYTLFEIIKNLQSNRFYWYYTRRNLFEALPFSSNDKYQHLKKVMPYFEKFSNHSITHFFYFMPSVIIRYINPFTNVFQNLFHVSSWGWSLECLNDSKENSKQCFVLFRFMSTFCIFGFFFWALLFHVFTTTTRVRRNAYFAWKH